MTYLDEFSFLVFKKIPVLMNLVALIFFYNVTIQIADCYNGYHHLNLLRVRRYLIP